MKKINDNLINLFGSKIVPNTGEKYSELLEKFMTPFANDFRDHEYIEDIMEFAINAWNMANLNIIMPDGDIENAIDSLQNKDGEVSSLLKRMMTHKETDFKEFTNFIVDYEIKEAQLNKDPILSVVTQEQEPYLANMEDHFKNEATQNDHEENYIDRYAIILKPKRPFFDWVSNLNPEEYFEEDMFDTNIYLVDHQIEDVEKWLMKKFDKFFMMELVEWCDNKKDWPQKRNFKMFNLWFHVAVSKDIYDTERKPITKIE